MWLKHASTCNSNHWPASARQVPPIDTTLHLPPTAHRCIDIAAAVENFCAFCKRVASSRPELPTRANCCLKMRQCNYTNENASSNDFLIQPPFPSPSLLSTPLLCSVSICMLFTLVLWPPMESSWQHCSMHDCSNALWSPLSEASAANHSCLAQSPLKVIRQPSSAQLQPLAPLSLSLSLPVSVLTFQCGPFHFVCHSKPKRKLFRPYPPGN